jgi:predicted transcriptional regulator
MIQGLYETNVVTVTSDQPLSEVVELMRSHKIGDVIVVESDKPCGIITDRDIALKAFSGDQSLITRLKVSDVMSGGIVTAKESDWLLDIVDTMKDAGVVRLPVIDSQGKLCGVITDLHCMQALSEALDKVTHIQQKDADESAPPTMATDRALDQQRATSQPSIQ